MLIVRNNNNDSDTMQKKNPMYMENLMSQKKNLMYMDHQAGWASIHRHTKHGLAICYDTTNVEIVQEFSPTDVLQLFPVM